MSTIPPVSDPRFDPNFGDAYEPKAKRSPWMTCLIGCLIVVLILLVVAAGVIFWISRNWRGWAAGAGSQAVKEMIDQSQLDVQEKVEINVQVDRLATAFRENQISPEQASQLIQNLVKSPLMTSFIVSAIDKGYFEKSGLSEEEKTAGRITLQRFASGMIDGKINEQGIDNAMQHVATKRDNGRWEVRQPVTDTELRAFLAAAKAEADQAGVVEEPPQFDPSEEFRRIIDEALDQPGQAAERAPVPVESAEPQPNQ